VAVDPDQRFGAQVTMLAIPLTAAVLLHATPTQMGFLTAMELAPFVLFSLPAGVWLDRVRKLPVYVTGELLVAFTLASVPVTWMLGWLGMATSISSASSSAACWWHPAPPPRSS
jgi:MFS family permease